MKIIGPAVLAALMLTACSAGPSENDIQAALVEHVQKAAGGTPFFQNLETGKCSQDNGSARYTCSVNADLELTLGRNGRTIREPLTGTFVFEEVGDSWRVVSSR